MPPSASSKRPTRSALASVKAPLTWPKSSLSNTPSDTPPALTVTIGFAARPDTEWIARATRPLPVPFSPVISTLASEGPTRAIICEHGLHRPRLRDQRGLTLAAAAQQRIFRLEALAVAERPAQLGLRAQDREQARVLPRLLDEVAGAAAHGLDGDVDAAPGGHHDDRQRGSSARRWLSRSSPSWPDVVSRA